MILLGRVLSMRMAAQTYKDSAPRNVQISFTDSNDSAVTYFLEEWKNRINQITGVPKQRNTMPIESSPTELPEGMEERLSKYKEIIPGFNLVIDFPKTSAAPFTSIPEPDCCSRCPNNPRVNPSASGICHCTLPSMNNIRY